MLTEVYLMLTEIAVFSVFASDVNIGECSGISAPLMRPRKGWSARIGIRKVLPTGLFIGAIGPKRRETLGEYLFAHSR
jgi:hypothetical protein